MTKSLSLISLLVSLNGLPNIVVSKECPEQAAFDFFCEEIAPSEYPSVQSFIFGGEISGDYLGNDPLFLKTCLDGKDFFRKIKENSYNYKKYGSPLSECAPIKVKPDIIKFKRPKKRHLKKEMRLVLYKPLSLERKILVSIAVKKKSSVDRYDILVDQEGDIIDWCATGVVFSR